MESLACVLLGVGFVIFVIVAVVHFLYSLAAGGRGEREFPGGDCPKCAARISHGTICPKCGYHLGKQKIAALEDELDATVRQVNRLATNGRISDSIRREVLDAVGADIADRGAKGAAAVAAAKVRATRAAEGAARQETAATAAPPVPIPSGATLLPDPRAAGLIPADVRREGHPPGPAGSATPATKTPAPVEPPPPEGEWVEPIEVTEVVHEAEASLTSPESEPRGLAGILQSFMEEKNIRWGELVSGLLIVVSSVGLVISLWATLKQWIPYFPVAVFLAATAAMHGAGLYTLKRWRLKSTSRGLLLVSTLLVPLNVLAAMVLNANKPAYGPIDYAAVTLGLAALAGLVFSAARILNKRNPWPMFIAVTGSAVGMSLIGRLTVPGESEERTLLLFALPFASFIAAAIAQVKRLSAGNHLSPRRAAQSFRFLGIGLFALSLSAAFLAVKSAAILPTLSLLSPLVSLLAATLTAAGLVIQQRMSTSGATPRALRGRAHELRRERQTGSHAHAEPWTQRVPRHPESAAQKVAGYRTTGTAIALFGGVLVLAAVVLAWPRPDLLVEVGLLNAIAFSALAFMSEMPALHLFATASFSLACLIGLHWSAGRITIASATTEGLAELLREARSGLILAVLSLVADGAALVLRQTRYRLHASGYSGSALLHAGAAAAVAVFAIVWELPDRNLATAVFLVLSLRWLVAAWWIRRPYASWIGATLLLAALGHGFAINSEIATRLADLGWNPTDPWTVALLAHAVICTLYAGIARIDMARTGAGTTPFLETFEKLFARVGALRPLEPRMNAAPPDARGAPEGAPTAHATSSDPNAQVRASAAAEDRGDQPLGSAEAPSSASEPEARGSLFDALVVPFSLAAIVVSALAIPSMLHVSADRFYPHAAYGFVIAAVWFAAALSLGLPALAGAAEAVGTITIAFGVTGYCQTQSWWNGSLAAPLHLNWQFGALAVWSGLWIAARRAVRPISAIARVLLEGPSKVDRFVLGAVVAGFTATCSLAIAPGLFTQEVLLDSTALNPLPLHLVVLAPFLIAGLLIAFQVLFGKHWEQSVSVFGLAIIFAVCLARAPIWRGDVFWPGFPSPYGQGWGAGAWIALGLISLALIAAHWERPTFATVVGISSMLAATPFLIACRWDSQLATASALCWASAGLAVIVALLWSLRPIGGAPRFARNSLVASTGFSLLAIVVGNLVSVVGGAHITAGPSAESIFGRMGPAATDAIPLALLAASFAIYAVVERSFVWGLAATFFAQFAFGVARCYVLAPQSAGAAGLVHFVEEMGLAAALAAAAWLMLEPFVTKSLDAATRFAASKAALYAQIALGSLFAAIVTGAAAFNLLISPVPLTETALACGTPLGWCLLLAAVGVWCLLRRDTWPTSAVAPAFAFFAAAAPLAAASLDKWNEDANWLSFHTAVGLWCGLIGVVAATTIALKAVQGPKSKVQGQKAKSDFGATAEDTGEPRPSPVAPDASPVVPEHSPVAPKAFDFGPWTLDLGLHLATWSFWLTPIVAVFALRGLPFDPMRPWWSAGSMIWISLCALVFAATTATSARANLRAYLSLAFAVLGSVLIGLNPWLWGDRVVADQKGLDLVHITLIGATLQALVWAAMVVVRERRGEPVERLPGWPPVHQFVAIFATFAASLPVVVLLAHQLLPLWPQWFGELNAASALGWSSLALLACLSFATLWERESQYGLPVLYALGLIAVVTGLRRLNLPQDELFVWSSGALAAYVVATGGVWAGRRPLRGMLQNWGARLAEDEGKATHQWLSTMNLALAAIVIICGFGVLRLPETNLRVGLAVATLVAAAGVALLPWGLQAWRVQLESLVIGAIAAVQFGWALMEPAAPPNEPLNRAIRLLVSLAAVAFVYGVPLVRLVPREISWFASIRRAAVGVAGTAVVALGLILWLEFQSFDRTTGSPVSVIDTVVVAIALVALAAGLISLAVLPGRDPLFSTEKQRFFYVYGSEVVAGLLFAHLYLTNPQLFQDWLKPYWPLVVMGIAFAGTGISEFFGRLKVNVLSRPLEYTAAFLPVLPVIGFWLLDSDLKYSTTLFIVGVLYLFLSLRRGSFVYSAAAAIVGNATLCALFGEHGVSLLVHPQMFIIPPCVTVLAAAQLNRDRLSEGTLASIRYFAITTIYVSSTGEMFQHGIGTTLWLPMVLAGLSVLGVLAGIMLRVRAFLYLGTSFLLLSMVSMVWHAARSIGDVWPWWAFLFVLGLALLTLFGVFEKKRPEMLALIEQLRAWER
jgi:hypothetical protein